MVKLYIPMNPIVHSLKMLSNGILEILVLIKQFLVTGFGTVPLV